MKPYPKITIVTPSFNQAIFLERTILSVINQGYPNLEYIIIDGGSTDGSVDIIKKYESHISKWVSEPDSGQSNAINKGFKMATGDLYNWLNSDDILYPATLKIVAEYCLKYPNHQVFYGDRVIIDKDDRVLKVNEGPSFKRWESKMYLKIPQETTFFSKSIWNKVNGLNEDLHYTMDVDLWRRFLKYTDFIHIPFYLGAYREHDLSKSVEVFGPNKSSDRAAWEIERYKEMYATKWHRHTKVQKLAFLLNQGRLAYEKSSRKGRVEADFIYSLIENGQQH